MQRTPSFSLVRNACLLMGHLIESSQNSHIYDERDEFGFFHRSFNGLLPLWRWVIRSWPKQQVFSVCCIWRLRLCYSIWTIALDVCDELFWPSLEIEEHKKRLVRLFLLGSRILDGAISYFILFSPVNKLFVGQLFLGFDRNPLGFYRSSTFCVSYEHKKVRGRGWSESS